MRPTTYLLLAVLLGVVALVAGCVDPHIVQYEQARANALAEEVNKAHAKRVAAEHKAKEQKLRAQVELRSASDPAAAALIRCSQLGFVRGTDGHQNCVIRALDRVHKDVEVRDEILAKPIPDPVPVPTPPTVVVPPAYPSAPLRTPDGGYIYPSYVPPMQRDER